MRTPLKTIAKAALTRSLPILLILIIGGIGVQTITSCSGDDPDNDGSGSKVEYDDDGNAILAGTIWEGAFYPEEPEGSLLYGILWTLTFTDTDYSIITTKNNEPFTEGGGTYTVSGNTVTFTSEGVSANATISGNKLTTRSIATVVYTKK